MELITKISFKNNYTTEISMADNAVGNGDGKRQKEIKHTIEAVRHADFERAMSAPVMDLLKKLELPEEWENSVVLKHVSIKRTDAHGLGAIFTLIKSYDDIGGVLCINSPLLHEDLGETNQSKMGDYLHEALMKILDEAQAFLSGKQAQGELPFDHGDDNEEESEDAEKWGKQLTNGDDESKEDYKDEILPPKKKSRKKKRVVHMK